MADYDYDLFVIGAGSGGVRAARLTALDGKKVAVAEEYRVGGTCVIRGCVPKKFMVMASEVSHALEIAEHPLHVPDHEPIRDTRGLDLLRRDLRDVLPLPAEPRELRVVEDIRPGARGTKIGAQALAPP